MAANRLPNHSDDAVQGRKDLLKRLKSNKPGVPYWLMRDPSFRVRRIFESADDLIDAAGLYFEWARTNPIEVQVWGGNPPAPHPEFKERALTLQGLCYFLNIETKTWVEWRREREDLKEAITEIDKVIHTQKFEGAAVGLFNAQLIQRDLGLADAHTVSGPDGGPIRMDNRTITTEMTAKEAAEAYAATLRDDS